LTIEIFSKSSLQNEKFILYLLLNVLGVHEKGCCYNEFQLNNLFYKLTRLQELLDLLMLKFNFLYASSICHENTITLKCKPSNGKHSLDQISVDLFTWLKVSVKFGVWLNALFVTWSKV
jgi:hypothetical protein